MLLTNLHVCVECYQTLLYVAIPKTWLNELLQKSHFGLHMQNPKYACKLNLNACSIKCRGPMSAVSEE